jgi:CDP-glucose 4,6-dehydratase
MSRSSYRGSHPASTAAPAAWAEALHAWFGGRSVLITGHTGFKGSWLALWLHQLGAQVTGYALDPPTDPSNFVVSSVVEALALDHRADIREQAALEAVLRSSRPDVILHLAAQSVVLESYATPADTFSVNVLGTAVVLDAIRAVGRRSAVVIVTSDKCYANDESGRRFEEDDPLGGDDPYSASKAGTELVAAAYRHSFFPPESIERHGIAIATARAGNVIGGGDWTPYGVVADIVRSIGLNEPVRLRRPNAIRPWQHVLEPLAGYLTLAMRLGSPDGAGFCRAWNFGPEPDDEMTVRELTERFISESGAGSWLDDSHPDDLPEAGVLRLSTRLARDELDWRPRWRLAEAVERTARWYQRFAASPLWARDACLSDIDAYMSTKAGDVRPTS